MPDGSPIDQWWKSHRSPVVTTNAKTAVHLVGEHPKAYCGHRGGDQTGEPELVTCSACVSARTADAVTVLESQGSWDAMIADELAAKSSPCRICSEPIYLTASGKWRHVETDYVHPAEPDH